MNIGEAGDVATVLHAITTGRTHLGPIEADTLAEALHRLNERAGKALQLARIADTSDLEVAARQIVQRAADAV